MTLTSPLDFEETETLLVTVVATDGGTPALSSSAVINVTVIDVNDNAPVFSERHYESFVAEDALVGEQVLQVSLDQHAGQDQHWPTRRSSR